MYWKLLKEVGHVVEVMPLELPGHNSRMGEPLETELRSAATKVADVIQEYVTREGQQRQYALFGHSMGGWIAYEAAVVLSKRAVHQPTHLFVAGNRAPQYAKKDLDSTVMHKLSFDEFWPAMARRYGPNPALEIPEIQRAVWPILKADFGMCEKYEQDTSQPPLAVPVTALGGDQDCRVAREHIQGWGAHTSAAFTDVWLPGAGHDFVSEPHAGLVAAVTRVFS